MNKKIIISSIALVVIIIICFLIFMANSKDKRNNDFTQMRDKISSEEQRGKTQEKQTTISSNSEIKSALTENLELHTTYYLSEVYVEKNQYVESGANILKYTNGEYLTAPYDCYVLELNIPDVGGKCVNNNYIQIESKNVLSVSMNVDETQIDKINIGDEATIEVTATDTKYTGNVTHIGNTANNGKFEITIEFENDGNVKIGMTSKVEMTI